LSGKIPGIGEACMQKVGGFLEKGVGGCFFFFFFIICLQKYLPMVRFSSANPPGVTYLKGTC